MIIHRPGSACGEKRATEKKDEGVVWCLWATVGSIGTCLIREVFPCSLPSDSKLSLGILYCPDLLRSSQRPLGFLGIE